MKPWIHASGAALAAILLLPVASAQTQPRLSASTFVGVHNSQYNGHDGYLWTHALDYEYNQSHTYLTPVAASASVSDMEYSGMDSLGHTQTMAQSGHAVALAQFPFAGKPYLRVYADGLVTNTFYHPDNPPYFDASNGGFAIDPDGAPDNMNTYAHATFRETLQWTGTATNYKAYYRFRIKGHVAPGSSGHVHLYVESLGLSDSWDLPINAAGLIDEYWVTNQFPAGLGFPQQFTASLIAQFVAQTQYVPEGSEVSGTFNFGALATPVFPRRAGDAPAGAPEIDATITLDAIYIADEEGNRVEGWTLETESGSDYELINGAPPGVLTEVFENGFEPQDVVPTRLGQEDGIAPGQCQPLAQVPALHASQRMPPSTAMLCAPARR